MYSQVVMAVLVFPIPESPSWLVSKRLYARADRALAWLGRDQEEFATEIELDLQQRMSKVVWLIKIRADIRILYYNLIMTLL